MDTFHLPQAFHPMHHVRVAPAGRSRHREITLRRELRAETQQPDGGGCPPAICGPGPASQAIHEIQQLIETLINFFTGVPRSLKSLEVVQRLFNVLRQEQGSRAFHDVARTVWNLLRLIQQGDVLSESGAGQRRIYDLIFRHAQLIAHDFGLPVHQVERDLTRAIFGDDDRGLRALLRRESQPAPGPPGAPGLPGGAVQPAPGGAPQPSFRSCATECAAALELGPEAYAACVAACEVPALTPPDMAQIGRQVGERIGRMLTRQPQQQPLTQQPPAPVLDTTTPCPTCDRIGRQLTQQRQQLEREIQTEQAQQLEPQIEAQQQELQELQQLEQQPAQQRDIQQELKRKQELLQQIESEQRQLQQTQTQPQPLPPGERAPELQPAQPQLQQPPPAPPVQGVTFCVGCKSEEDAILFLNGEQAGCSVIPGSTHPLAL
jgi:hypothetical protein